MVERAATLAAIEAALTAAGVRYDEVRLAGMAGEIALIRADAACAARLAELAPSLKGDGVRYIAMDLAGSRDA